MSNYYRLFCFLSLAVLWFLNGAAQAQIVALGASNTEGYGVSSSSAWPAQLEAMLAAKGRALGVRNAGVTGNTTAEMLDRLEQSVPDGTKIVLLQIGGNDMRHGITPAERAANVARIKSILASRGIKVIQVDSFVAAALKAGMRQADDIHLTPEGHTSVATKILPSIR